MLRLNILTLALVFGLSSLCFAQKLTTKTATKLLKEGSVVSVNANGQPITKLLNYLEKKTGNKVKFTDKFGRPHAKTSSIKVNTVFKKKNFWTIIQHLQELTEFDFDSINNGELKYTEESFHNQNQLPNGDSVVAGAFLITPDFDKFHKYANIKLRPEPRIQNGIVLGFKGVIEFKDGSKEDFEPKFFSNGFKRFGEVVFSLQGDFDSPSKHVAKSFEAIIDYEFPVKLETLTTPGFKEVIPQDIKKGAVTITPLGFNDAKKMTELKFRLHGSKVSRENIKVIDDKKKEVTPYHFNSSNFSGNQEFTIVLKGKKTQKQVDKMGLKMDLPKFKEIDLGKLKKPFGKPIQAGLAKVTISQAEKKNAYYEIKLESDRSDVDFDKAVLVSASGDEIEKSGMFSFSRKGKTQATMQFQTDKVKGNISNYSLKLNCPTSIFSVEIKDIGLKMAKTAKAGKHEVKVMAAINANDEFNGDHLKIRFHAPTSVNVNDVKLLKGNEELKNIGWSSSNLEEYQVIELQFKGKFSQSVIDKLRLQMPIPSETVKHQIRAKLKNLKLK